MLKDLPKFYLFFNTDREIQLSFLYIIFQFNRSLKITVDYKSNLASINSFS
jgi:hypothetical protein